MDQGLQPAPIQEGSSIPHRLIPYGDFPHLDRSGQSFIVKQCRHFRFASLHENGAFGLARIGAGCVHARTAHGFCASSGAGAKRKTR